MKEPIRFCKEECDKTVTINDIVNSVDCSFCDCPYLLTEISKLDNYDELMINKESYDESIKEYDENIREFFKHYTDMDGFNGVINTFDIKFKTRSRLYPCEVVLGWQRLPLKAITDFCEVFDYYLPTIEIKEGDMVYNLTKHRYEPQQEFNYTFKKKR